jgi:hypothetical protein
VEDRKASERRQSTIYSWPRSRHGRHELDSSIREIQEIDRREIMAFVNEIVSDEDAKKYDFEGLSKTLRRKVWQLKEGWTIDRTRNIFLIWLGSGQEEFFRQNRFLLWWDGQILTIRINGEDSGNYSGKLTTTWDSPAIALPDVLEPIRAEVITTLKEALAVFKYAGYAGQAVNHTAAFNF